MNPLNSYSMETLFDWLLHNVGNEGNDLTILNVLRQTTPAQVPFFEVMARPKDFTLVNLLIYPAQAAGVQTPEPIEFANRKRKNSYFFSSEEQVIAYLSNGHQTKSADESESAGIRVVVLEPTDEASGLAFPPK